MLINLSFHKTHYFDCMFNNYLHKFDKIFLMIVDKTADIDTKLPNVAS